MTFNYDQIGYCIIHTIIVQRKIQLSGCTLDGWVFILIISAFYMAVICVVSFMTQTYASWDAQLLGTYLGISRCQSCTQNQISSYK